MPTVTIDKQKVIVPGGTTIMAAAAHVGITIPSLCYDASIEPPCSCFVCVVKVEGKASLVPSCVAVAEEGMEIDTAAPEVVQARRQALELLLAEHAGDCEAPCSRVCPAGLDIPHMLRMVASGGLSDALTLVHEQLLFPGILGTICRAPCEAACRRKRIDTTIGIRAIHRTLSLECNPPSGTAAKVPAKSGEKQVACIGAGPAGLAAAYHLVGKGYHCTVFDAHDVPGGMLRYGVAREVLAPEVIDRDMKPLEEMGVAWRLGVTVGDSISLQSVTETFDAVVIATGAPPARGESTQNISFGETAVTFFPETLTTDIAGVFVCGAVVTPGKMAARAVGQGRRVAEMVERYLETERTENAAVPGMFDARCGQLDNDELDVLRKTVSEALGTECRNDGAVNETAAEAARCLQCDCGGKMDCVLRKIARENGIWRQPVRAGKRRRVDRRYSDHIVYEPGKCILCGKCIALTAGMKPGLTFVGRGFDVIMDAPFNYTLDEAAGERALRCTGSCPTGALRMRERDGCRV